MRTRTKLGLSLVALFSSLPLMIGTGNGYFILLLLIGLPAAILSWFDLGRELRAIPSPTRTERALGLAMGVPQVLFGLLCAVIGLLLVVWILYNLLIEHQSQFRIPSLPAFAAGPMMIVVGLGWARTAFRRAALEQDAPEQDIPD
ncbi:TPA: hypothetical protein ACKP89_003519 [Stenotrophomonas maltophilia]|jgi:hypothetical protein|uniref:hypothetical protein n=1 Tax=Stenotrophomonas maltophilia TaxID=40324 RepID=UPI001310DD6A|nr:hypothetical protein [Stenotrophomonas maltophilia]MBN5123566.1 hypothetical protein [Stenotrophomonas maltophilia]MBO3004783.1 hypothetical protein [Stenotrophomonas maltophilia]MBP1383725.1 hypothetical protein [Stenotrophomonas maltophilia]MBP1388492.1 hypothetical protein [Stenotrophomonas maltophilia]MCU1007493.1 hypothetical protein [Stenotrophomonas maltophilia]